MTVKSYRDLKVWAKAMDLVGESYRITKLLPKAEAYGLASQIQRAAVSITANIAEGHGRDHLGDYLRHLSIAKGSVMELETELLLAQRLQYVEGKDIANALQLADGVSRMLTGLTRTLGARFSRAPRPSRLVVSRRAYQLHGSPRISSRCSALPPFWVARSGEPRRVTGWSSAKDCGGTPLRGRPVSKTSPSECRERTTRSRESCRSAS